MYYTYINVYMCLCVALDDVCKRIYVRDTHTCSIVYVFYINALTSAGNPPGLPLST